MHPTLCFTVAHRIQLPLRSCERSTKAILLLQHPEKPKRGGSRPFWVSLSSNESRLERIDRAAPESQAIQKLTSQFPTFEDRAGGRRSFGSRC